MNKTTNEKVKRGNCKGAIKEDNPKDEDNKPGFQKIKESMT